MLKYAYIYYVYTFILLLFSYTYMLLNILKKSIQENYNNNIILFMIIAEHFCYIFTYF